MGPRHRCQTISCCGVASLSSNRKTAPPGKYTPIGTCAKRIAPAFWAGKAANRPASSFVSSTVCCCTNWQNVCETLTASHETRQSPNGVLFATSWAYAPAMLTTVMAIAAKAVFKWFFIKSPQAKLWHRRRTLTANATLKWAKGRRGNTPISFTIAHKPAQAKTKWREILRQTRSSPPERNCQIILITSRSIDKT